MKTLRQVWDFLNGRKTLLATAAASAYYALVQFNVVQPSHNVEALIALAISAGLVHKIYKVQ
jgi:hypothetical protein